jgi:hypothetical protein
MSTVLTYRKSLELVSFENLIGMLVVVCTVPNVPLQWHFSPLSVYFYTMLPFLVTICSTRLALSQVDLLLLSSSNREQE